METIKKWLSKNWDKMAHCLVCMVAFMPLQFPFGILFASIIVITLGFVKEFLDEKFDWMDILADMIGLTIAVVYTLLI